MSVPSRVLNLAALAMLFAGSVFAQPTQKLTLDQAEQLAIRNHPQIQAWLSSAPPIIRMCMEAPRPWMRRTTAA